MSYDPILPLWPEQAPGYQTASPRHVPSYTPYLLPRGESKALIVVLPGGGYGTRAPHEGHDIALWLNSIGVSALICHYRVSPYRHPYPSMDARRAIRTARFHAEEWGIDADKIGVIGFSAGGHLAATVSTWLHDGKESPDDEIDEMSARPNAAILCYAVLSFGEWGHDGSAANLLGDQLSPETRETHSHYRNVSPETPPCFLWHTAEDGGVPMENSLYFALACKEQGVPAELHVYPYGRHGLGLAKDIPHVAQWAASCANWLQELGWR